MLLYYCSTCTVSSTCSSTITPLLHRHLQLHCSARRHLYLSCARRCCLHLQPSCVCAAATTCSSLSLTVATAPPAVFLLRVAAAAICSPLALTAAPPAASLLSSLSRNASVPLTTVPPAALSSPQISAAIHCCCSLQFITAAAPLAAHRGRCCSTYRSPLLLLLHLYSCSSPALPLHPHSCSSPPPLLPHLRSFITAAHLQLPPVRCCSSAALPSSRCLIV